MPSRERVQQLIALVEKSQFVEAIREFYAEDATMQENLQPLRRGMEVLVAGEQKVLDTFKEVRTFPVTTFFCRGRPRGHPLGIRIHHSRWAVLPSGRTGSSALRCRQNRRGALLLRSVAEEIGSLERLISRSCRFNSAREFSP